MCCDCLSRPGCLRYPAAVVVRSESESDVLSAPPDPSEPSEPPERPELGVRPEPLVSKYGVDAYLWHPPRSAKQVNPDPSSQNALLPCG